MNPWVERALTNLQAAFGKKLTAERVAYYATRLMKWNLSEAAWSRVTSSIVSDLDTFPSISQIIPYLKSALKAGGNLWDVEPVFETWRDAEDRPYARPTGRFRSLVPSVHEVEQWKLEACSQTEGKRAFIQAFEESGGNIAKLDEILLSLRIGQR